MSRLSAGILDLEDPAEVKRWVVAVRVQASDAITAGLDATARVRRRALSRAEARRRLKAAEQAIGRRILAACLSLRGLMSGFFPVALAILRDRQLSSESHTDPQPARYRRTSEAP